MSVGMLVASFLIGFAAFRAWRIIGKDQITDPFRVWLIRRDGHLSEFVQDLIGCVWCAGFWIAGAASILVAVESGWSWIETGLVWLASSGVAGLAGEADERLSSGD